MTRLAAVLLLTAAVVAAAGQSRAADLKDIQTSRLPQDKSVLTVYGRVAAIEKYVATWTHEWKFEVTRESVVESLRQSVDELGKAMKASPDNVELLLLVGTVARYGYNVDLQGAHELAESTLERAHSLAPADHRSYWFLATHECQTMKATDGMTRFLDIEKQAGSQMSASFWDDYRHCATVTGMPAHALLGTLRMALGDEARFKDNDPIVVGARDKYKTPDVQVPYTAKDIWSAEDLGPKAEFTNTMFGFQFTATPGQELGLPDVQNGACLASVGAGPFKGKAGDVHPTIVTVARQARPGETLEEFVRTFLRQDPLERIDADSCPVDGCVRYRARKPGLYDKEGDGVLVLTAFRRDAPPFPGLIFEKPVALPTSDAAPSDKKGPAFFRLEKRWARLPGTMYYAVFLDTAASVQTQATAAYEAFLKTMRVE